MQSVIVDRFCLESDTVTVHGDRLDRIVERWQRRTGEDAETARRVVLDRIFEVGVTAVEAEVEG